MFEKNGKYFADWRDKSGRRMRRSFQSKRAALEFEAEQKARAHPKKKASRQALPHSCSPIFTRSTAKSGQSRASSSPLRVVSRRKT